jgi:hypothetical protein
MAELLITLRVSEGGLSVAEASLKLLGGQSLPASH